MNNNASKIHKLKGNSGNKVKIVHWRPVQIKHGYGELTKQVPVSKHGINKFTNLHDEILVEYKAIEAKEVKLASKGGETVAALVDSQGNTIVAAVVKCSKGRQQLKKV